VATISFITVIFVIKKFADQVTEPITALTNYTRKYRKKQTLEKKNKVINLIKKDPLFFGTVKVLEQEEYIAGLLKT